MDLIRLFLPNDEEVDCNETPILILQTINTIHPLFPFRLLLETVFCKKTYDRINTQSLTPRREM
jgi:hypothetical protein